MARVTPPGALLRGIGAASWLVARAGRGVLPDAIGGDDLTRRRMAQALGDYLWRPLVMLVPLAALVGIVAGTVASRLLAVYHVERAIEPVIAQTLCRDIVPLLIGVFASGRVSVDLAARLAGASLAREIDALEVLGHDPVRHMLSPALLGVIVAVPVHVAVAAIVALAATGFVIAGSGETQIGGYLHLVGETATARALATGIAKAALFALIAFAVGAAVGSGGARSPAAIAARATAAATLGLLGVLAAAALWTTLA